VAIALIVGGIIILFIESKDRTDKVVAIEDLSYKDAFCVGLIQCVAMIPGVSRSASTIIGGMILGASRAVATEFSFFLAIPTIFAATAYSLLKYKGVLDSNQLIILAIGFIVSFGVALGVVKFLIRFVQGHNFKVFGYYRIILGVIILGYFFMR
jgi:undecaprenyl-diphosphatase